MIDRYRNHSPYKMDGVKPRQTKKHYYRGFIFVLLVLIAGGFFINLYLETNSQMEANKNSTAFSNEKIQISAEPISQTTWSDLSEQINKQISLYPELSISVAVVDVNTNTKANYGIQENFVAASTSKILTAVTFFHKVEQGEYSMKSPIEEADPTTLLRQMINQSNNESWHTLNRKVTYTTLKQYAKTIGLSSYNHEENAITASDLAILLQKLYKKELLNSEHTELLLSYMQNTNNETMIPTVIPEGATVFHKYGQLEDRLHDIAIIEFQERPLVLAILTKAQSGPTRNYQTRAKIIQDLAKTVFETIYPAVIAL